MAACGSNKTEKEAKDDKIIVGTEAGFAPYEYMLSLIHILAKMAVEETGMGIVEDKVIKNHYAAEYIYNAYKDTKTCGVIEEDKAYGIKKIAEPIGLIAAVIPTTNPTSTAIFKTLIALKTRNAIIISPHPRAKNATIAAAKVVLEAAVKAGAPEGIDVYKRQQTDCRKTCVSGICNSAGIESGGYRNKSGSEISK